MSNGLTFTILIKTYQYLQYLSRKFQGSHDMNGRQGTCLALRFQPRLFSIGSLSTGGGTGWQGWLHEWKIVCVKFYENWLRWLRNLRNSIILVDEFNVNMTTVTMARGRNVFLMKFRVIAKYTSTYDRKSDNTQYHQSAPTINFIHVSQTSQRTEHGRQECRFAWSCQISGRKEG